MSARLRALRRIWPPPSPIEPSIRRSGSSMFFLFPDAQGPKLFAGGPGPIFVGGGTRGAGMQNLSNLRRRVWEERPGAFLRETPDSNQPFRLENFNHAAEMFIASGEDRSHAGGREFVGRDVAAGFGKKSQRAIIDDEMIFEKGLRAGELLSE